MSQPRIAVIGTGHLGKIHARLLAAREDAQLVVVVDPIAESREAVAEQHQVASSESIEPWLDKIDAAVVVSPTCTHFAVVQRLLEAGKHVLVEKPMTPTAAEAESLARLAKKKQRILQVGHVERFNPVFLAARKHVGVPKFIEATRASGYSFRSTDIGVVLDLMIHDIDLVLSLAQSEVTRVDAVGLTVMGPNEDVAQARLRFANGCVANLTASRTSYEAQRTMRVFGTEGFASADLGSHSLTWIKPSEAIRQQQVDVNQLSPEQRNHYKEKFFEELLPLCQDEVAGTNAIQDEHSDFVRCMTEQGTPIVSGSDGWRAVQVAELVLQSIERHSWDGTTLGPRGANALWTTDSPLRKAG